MTQISRTNPDSNSRASSGSLSSSRTQGDYRQLTDLMSRGDGQALDHTDNEREIGPEPQLRTWLEQSRVPVDTRDLPPRLDEDIARRHSRMPAFRSTERPAKPVWFGEDAPRISVVIPALNEATNLPHVLPRIPEWIDEVVLVDGHSTDGTVSVARALLPDIRVVVESAPGKGAALRRGFAAATGDIIVMLDADGSTDPKEIPVFLGALLSGADFVKGSRFMQGAGSSDMTGLRRLGNWGFVWMSKVLFGASFSDLCYGYSAFWSRVVPTLALDADGFEIETLMNIRALQAGLRVAEVPSFEFDRIHGTSRLQTFPDGWRVLKTLVRERLKPQVRHEARPLVRSIAAYPQVEREMAFAPVRKD